MPRPTADHAAHDPLLVAAYAAGDATGADLDAATALVATCEACAGLHRDLRAIAAALPELPAPVRSRDFRLTPGQAASLRPSGWRRVLAPLAGPRFAFAAPLGATMATLGLAGVLIAGGAVLPLAGSAASAPSAAAPMAAGQAAGDAAGTGEAAGPQDQALLAPGATAAPAPLANAGAASAAPAPSAAASGAPAERIEAGGTDDTGAAAATPYPRVAMAPVRTPEPTREKAVGLETGPPVPADAVLSLAILALAGGLVLIALRFAARPAA